MKFRHYFFLGAVLLNPGCAFFGVERTDCLPDEDCSVGLNGGDGDGDGDGDVGGDGDGDILSSGGSGDGDGDGDGDTSTGGGGDGDVMGGASSGGGRAGSGGAPSGGRGGASGGIPGGGTGGGSGGMPTGGSGGMPIGGSGGMPTGGSGGMSGGAGGTGGAGVGGAAQVARDLQINEIYTQFVEIYFTGAVETSFSLDDLRIVVDGDAAKACQLTGGLVNASSPFLVAQRASMPCLNGSNCVAGCSFDSIGESVEVRLEMLINGSYEMIDQELSAALGTGESYQARPDGSDDFTKSAPVTPGATNGN